jgi:lactate dehydrogenase-like 2-hydroxyacid dehydrogenase
MKPTVMVMQPHLEPVAGLLAADYEVLCAWRDPPASETEKVQALVVAGEAPLDKARIETMPQLGLIACFTVGYDGIDVAWARARGIAVTHAPGANHEDVADHAIGLILASRRGIVSGDLEVRSGGWSASARTLTRSLGGQRVGIVGLGAIGEAVAHRCEVMRMPVAWWGPRAKADAPWPRAATLETLAQDSDILVVACRADETNRGLISAAVIAALGPKGLLVNIGRGQLVDEDALRSALKDGRLGAAALDVFAQEPTPTACWSDVPNTVLTPHTAGATQASVAAMLAMLKTNLAAFFAGAPLATETP